MMPRGAIYRGDVKRREESKVLINEFGGLIEEPGKSGDFEVGFEVQIWREIPFKVVGAVTRKAGFSFKCLEKCALWSSEKYTKFVKYGPDWLFDIDALTRTMNYKPNVADSGSTIFQGPKSHQDDDSNSSSKEEIRLMKINEKNKRKDRECNIAIKEDNVNSTNNVNAASTNEVNTIGGKTSIELPLDPNMPELEDYSIFKDDEDVE
ncbi:hypothetical protein Tco_1200370 [Tanacetum coccineum]